MSEYDIMAGVCNPQRARSAGTLNFSWDFFRYHFVSGLSREDVTLVLSFMYYIKKKKFMFNCYYHRMIGFGEEGVLS